MVRFLNESCRSLSGKNLIRTPGIFNCLVFPIYDFHFIKFSHIKPSAILQMATRGLYCATKFNCFNTYGENLADYESRVNK